MHMPSDLREEFIDVIDRFNSVGNDDDELKRLTGKLWNCTDTLPGNTCIRLEVAIGSTYAQAARQLRRTL
jgi:hypothetical protein